MERRYYIDYLKALGCIAIVVLHVITNRLDHTDTTELNYYVLSGLLVLTRWAVPVFVMVSGCNLLGRDNEKELVKRHVVKMLVLTFVWGVIYLLADPLINLISGKPIDIEFITFQNLFQGSAYHLWFCFMITGLYLLIPILNQIVKSKAHCEYFILMCMVSTFLLPFFHKLGENFPILSNVIAYIKFPQFNIYICYFVLGYYLDRYVDFTFIQRKIIYATTIAAIAVMIGYGYFYALTQHVHMAITQPENITVYFFSIGVFVFFKHFFKKGRMYPVVALLAKYSFGIYVLHSYLIIRLSWKGIHATMCNPWIAVPLVTIIVVSICLVASIIIKKAPYVGKWII